VPITLYQIDPLCPTMIAINLGTRGVAKIENARPSSKIVMNGTNRSA
jgi:hypothetical protein